MTIKDIMFSSLPFDRSLGCTILSTDSLKLKIGSALDYWNSGEGICLQYCGSLEHTYVQIQSRSAENRKKRGTRNEST